MILFRSKTLFIARRIQLRNVLLAKKFCRPRSVFSGMQVGIVGAPFSKGQSKAGTEQGPEAMRAGGLVQEIQRLGLNVQDYGDLVFEETGSRDGDKRIKSCQDVASAVELLSKRVERTVREARVPLTLGGDHSLGIGTIHGHAQARPDLCVIWVDAHADINTANTTRTGHMHGMSASFLIKEIAEKFKNPNGDLRHFKNIQPCISSSNFAYIGLRDLDEAENKILRDLEPSLSVFSMRDIDKLGIFEVISRALDTINPSLQRPIHVSFDIDAIDEANAPSTGTSVPGGLTVREALTIGEQVAATKLLSGLDLVEVNPLIGSQGEVKRTVNCAINVILSFLGRKRTDLYARHPSESFYAAH